MRHLRKQAEWHQFTISALRNALVPLQEFCDKLRDTQDQLSKIFHDVGAHRSKAEVKRRRWKDTKKSAKEKLERQESAPLQLINRLCIFPNISELCFPDGTSNHQETDYIIKAKDLKDKNSIMSSIKPAYDQKHYDGLKEKKNTFDTESQEVIDSIWKEKVKYLEKRNNTKLMHSSGYLREQQQYRQKREN